MKQKTDETLQLDAILDEYGTRPMQNTPNRERALDTLLEETDSASHQRAAVKQEPKVKKAPVQKQASSDQAGKPLQNKSGKKLKLDPYGNPIKKRKKDDALRRSEPANDFKPSDVRRPEVSFMNSVAAMEAAQRAKMRPDTPIPEDPVYYDDAVVTSSGGTHYEPNIRPMQHSTRAREAIADRRSRGKNKRKKQNFTYPKETPRTEGARYAVEPEPEPKRRVKFIIDDLQKQPEAAPSGMSASAPSVPFLDEATQTFTKTNRPPQKDAGKGKQKGSKTKKPHYDRPEDFRMMQREFFALKGTIFLRVLILFIAGVLSCYLVLANQSALPLPSAMRISSAPQTYLIAQLFLGFISIMASGSILRSGMLHLFQLKADTDSLSALTALTSIFAAILCIRHPTMLSDSVVHCYIPIAILSLLFHTYGKLLLVSRASSNARFLSKDLTKYALTCVEDERTAENLTRGTTGDYPILAAARKTDYLCDFKRYTYSTDLSDRYCRIAVPVLFLISLVLSVFLAILRKEQFESAVCLGASVCAMCFAATASLPLGLICNIPLNKGAHRFSKNKALILGYQSVDDFYDVNSVMADASTLFPEGTATLSAIKVFSDTKIDDVILTAASLTEHAGSMLRGVFRDSIYVKEKLPSVENFQYEEGLGLCGWIHNKRILFGSRELMVSHNIEGIPTRGKEAEYTEGGKEAIYLSVSGNLSALFIVEIQANPAIQHWLHKMDRNDVFLLLHSCDFFLTQRRLSELFGIPEDIIKVLPERMAPEFLAETAPAKRISASMVTTGKFSATIQLLLGTKSIRQTAITGLILQSAAACLGLAIGVLFLLLSAYTECSANLFLTYNLISAAVTLLAVGSKRI